MKIFLTFLILCFTFFLNSSDGGVGEREVPIFACRNFDAGEYFLAGEPLSEEDLEIVLKHKKLRKVILFTNYRRTDLYKESWRKAVLQRISGEDVTFWIDPEG